MAPQATELAFARRDMLGRHDARALARECPTLSQTVFSARFKGSAMKRAKRRGLVRNAAVMLGNVGTMDDVPLVREHAAWVPGRLR